MDNNLASLKSRDGGVEKPIDGLTNTKSQDQSKVVTLIDTKKNMQRPDTDDGLQQEYGIAKEQQ